MYDGFMDDNWMTDTKYGRALTPRELRKKKAGRGVHVPNKNEAKLLRNLMSKTGLTEKEIREHKTYRKMLSMAQVETSSAGKLAKEAASVLKRITGEMKLPKEHPEVIAEFKREIEKPSPFSSRSRLKMYGAENLLLLIDKLRKNQKDGNKKTR